MYCKECGATLSSAAKFCAKCGAKVNIDTHIPQFAEPNYPVYSAQQCNVDAPKYPEKKKASKLKKAFLLIAIVLMCGVIAVGFLYYKWYNSPEQRIIRALDAGDFDEAIELFEQEDGTTDRQSLIKSLRDRIDLVKEDFSSSKIEYETAKMELATIQKMHIAELESELTEASNLIGQINTSRTHFNTAEAFLAEGKFSDAIKHYKQVVEEDENYEKAKSQLTVAIDNYRADTLSKAEQYAAGEDYSGAISLLKKALTVLPEDTALAQKVELYQSELAAKTKSDVLAAAEESASKKDYLNAMKQLKDYSASNPDDSDVQVAYSTYYDAYVEQVLEEADEKMADEDYKGAIQLVNNGLENAKDEEKLTAKLDEINAVRPVLLSELTPINQDGWPELNSGTPIDPFGNDYSYANNYWIIDSYGSNWHESVYYAEYRVYGKYKKLTGTIAAYTNMGTDGQCYIQVFIDDELQYTSPSIVRKTDAFDFFVDISGADYIKIILTIPEQVHASKIGVILSNIKLIPPQR